MTDHFAEAEQRLLASDYARQKGKFKAAMHEAAVAHVHATLAHTAAMAPAPLTPDERDRHYQTAAELMKLRRIVAEHIRALEQVTAGPQRKVLMQRFAAPLLAALEDAGIDIDSDLRHVVGGAEDEPEWLPNGGHDDLCAYVAGMSSRCTCRLSEQRATAQPSEVVHLSPAAGFALTPCCGRTPFELPATDRMTVDPTAVTCAGVEG